jgi:hypothetical protein
VAARATAAGRSRGGERIPALRASRTRLTTAIGALVAAGAVTASAGAGPWLAVAGAGLVVLAAGVALRRAALLPWAIAAVGAGWLLGRAHGAGVDHLAPLAGAGLLVAAELAYGSLAEDPRIRVDRGVTAAWLATIAVVAAGGGALGLLALAAADVAVSTGVLLSAAGVAAAVGAVALVVRLGRVPGRR